MAGVSIEAMLELWAAGLRDAKARIRPLFTQGRVASSAGLFLDCAATIKVVAGVNLDGDCRD